MIGSIACHRSHVGNCPIKLRFNFLIGNIRKSRTDALKHSEALLAFRLKPSESLPILDRDNGDHGLAMVLHNYPGTIARGLFD